jgi:arylsulfatase A-like enzyme
MIRRTLTAAIISGTMLVNASENQRPNIVLMMSDDQGWGETSYNGHPYLKTPVLDEMASTGIRFDRFYAASPVCSPTRASCMTGRHANRSGAFGAGWSIRPEEVTLPQLMKEAGYRTAHYGKWHIGAIKKGSPLSPNALGFEESLSHDNFFEMDSELSRNGNPPEPFKGDSSEFIVDEALKFAAQVAEEEQPFFIVLWFGSPHDPYSGYDEDIAPFKNLGEEISCRFAEITAMDRAIGTFREGLSRLGIRENTLIWFNSDNGITFEGIPVEQRKHLYNGNLSGNKSKLLEGGIKVPAVIEWPSVISGPRVSSVPCVTSDIFPTVIDIAGVKYPEPDRPLDGISLRELVVDGTMTKRPSPIGFWKYNWKPEMKNESWLDNPGLNEKITLTTRLKKKNRPSYFRNHRHDRVIPQNYDTDCALIDNNFKLLNVKKGKETVTALYDIEKDPREENNIAAQHPEVVERMQKQLRIWQVSVETSLAGADYRK